MCFDTEQHELIPHWKSLTLNLSSLRDEGTFCDLEIECEGRLINAHRIVLAAGIDYFRHMFESEMSECRDRRVKLECVPYPAFIDIINFAYTGAIDLNIENVWDICRAADFLLMESVRSKCEEFMVRNIEVENCFQMKALTYELSFDRISASLDEFFLENFESIYDNPDIGIYTLEEFSSLLRNDRLQSANDFQVFEAIVNWIEWDPEERLDSLLELMKTIRFLFLSADQILRIGRHPFVRGNPTVAAAVAKVHDFISQRNGGKPNRFDYEIPSIKRSIERRCRDSDCRFLPLDRNRSGGTLICLGGRREGPSPSVELFDKSANKWIRRWEAPFAGRQVGVTVIGRSVFVIGGHNGRGIASPCGMLDILSGDFVSIPSMPNPRRSMAVTQIADRYIFAIGGTDESKDSAFANTQRYDIYERRWISGSPMILGRRNLCAVSVGNYIYACGGCTGEESSYVGTAERYDFHKDKWEPLEPMNTARYNAGAAVLGHRIYLIGGFGQSGPLGDCEFFDIRTNKWSSISPLKTPRGGAGVVALGGRIYAVGGYNGNYLGTVECYDPILDEWEYCESLNDVRAGCGLGHIEAPIDNLYSTNFQNI